MNDSRPLPTDSTQPELYAFFQLLVEYFSRDELRELYFALGVGYDAMPGEGTRAKSYELIFHLGRLGRLDELRQSAVRQELGAAGDGKCRGADCPTPRGLGLQTGS